MKYNDQEENNYVENDPFDVHSDSDYYNQAKDAARKAKKAGKVVGKAANRISGKAGKAVTKGVSRAIIHFLPYIGGALAVLLVIIAVVAIVVYILTGPDILRGQVTAMVDEMIDSVIECLTSPIEGKDYAAITDENVRDVGREIDNMGFDLVGYGFVNDTEMDLMDEDNDGKLDRNEDKQLTKVNSELIKDYIAAENRTYMLSSVSLYKLWQGLKAWVDGKSVDSVSTGMIDMSNEIDAVTEIVINGRKIDFDKVATGENDNGSAGVTIKELKRDVEIDRKNKKMIITITEERIINKENNKKETKKTETKIVYNLEGWVGRYGKPIEFLLALHLGTMAPRFSQTVATSPEFETKVNMRLFKSVEVTRLTYHGMTLDETKEWLQKQVDEWWKYYQQVNAQNQAWYNAAVRANPNTARPKMYTYEDAKESAQKQLGITFEEIQKGKVYEDEHTEQHYTPYIVSVDNHWYKDWKFKDLNTASSDDAYVITKPTPKQSSVTFGGASFTATTYSSGEIYQIAEPKPKSSEPNKAFDDLFTNKEWTKVDGKTPLPAVESELKTDLSQLNLVKSKIDPEGLDMQTVVVMIEKASQKSDDAKFALRNLKEYLELKGFKFKDTLILTPNGKEIKTSEDNKTNSTGSWGESNNSSSSSSSRSSGSTTTGSTTSGGSSNKLSDLLSGKTANIVYNGNDAVIRTSEIQEGTSVKSIVGGTIEKVSDNAVQIKVTSPNSLNGNTIIISGVSMDNALKIGDKISKGTPIAKTTKDTDITIKRQDKNKQSASVKNMFE